MKQPACLAAFALMVGLSQPAHAELSCADWATDAFFAAATTEQVRDCIAGGVSIAERDPEGRTPLHLAAAKARDPAIAAELLRAGADSALTDEEGRRAIHSAAAEGQAPGILSYLAIWGSDIEAELPGGQRCGWIIIGARCATVPLHLAAARVDGTEFIAALLAAGADPDLRDADRRSALQHAASNAADELSLAVLLEAGASHDIADGAGLTPLHAAARRRDGAPEIIAILLAAGASADAGDADGTTPLMWAARRAPDSAIVEMLIEAADDPCVEDDAGRTALMLWDRNDALERDERYWELHERCQ